MGFAHMKITGSYLCSDKDEGKGGISQEGKQKINSTKIHKNRLRVPKELHRGPKVLLGIC